MLLLERTVSKLSQLSPFEKKPLDSDLFDFHASDGFGIGTSPPAFLPLRVWRPGWLILPTCQITSGSAEQLPD
jgi:hypothetical protein